MHFGVNVVSLFVFSLQFLVFFILYSVYSHVEQRFSSYLHIMTVQRLINRIATDRAAVDAWYDAAIETGGKDNRKPGLRITTMRATMGRLCLVLQGTMSRLFVTIRSEGQYSTSLGVGILTLTWLFPRKQKKK